MTKKTGFDPNQMLLNLKFKQKFDTFIESTRDIHKPVEHNGRMENLDHNDIAACYAVATTIKRAMQFAGLSREQIVDAINSYFNRSEEGALEDPPVCLKPLTTAMFDNYLSKPSKYRIPAYMIFAIQAITNSLAPVKLFVEAMGGEAITVDESRQLKIAKLQESQRQAKALETELRQLAVN